MKKILTLFFVLTLLVVLSACGAKKESAGEQGTPFNGSVDDLIKQGKSVKCVLQADAAAEILGGTTYVSGNKARSDFEQKGEAGQNYTGHFISDGTWMYSWNDVYKEQSVKIKIADLQNEAFKGQADQQGAENYEEKMNYQCYSWRVDNSFFTPPADVNFLDMTEMLKQFNFTDDTMPAFNNVDTSVLCGQCDQISDAAGKAACKQEMGCK